MPLCLEPQPHEQPCPSQWGGLPPLACGSWKRGCQWAGTRQAGAGGSLNSHGSFRKCPGVPPRLPGHDLVVAVVMGRGGQWPGTGLREYRVPVWAALGAYGESGVSNSGGSGGTDTEMSTSLISGGGVVVALIFRLCES